MDTDTIPPEDTDTIRKIKDYRQTSTYTLGTLDATEPLLDGPPRYEPANPTAPKAPATQTRPPYVSPKVYVKIKPQGGKLAHV